MERDYCVIFLENVQQKPATQTEKKNFLNLQHWWLFVKIYMLDLVLEVKMHVWVSPWGKGLNKILSCLQNYVCARIFEAWTFILLTFAQIFIYKVSRWSLFLSKFMKGMKQKSWHQIWISFVSMSFKCFMVNYCQTFTGVYCVSMDKLYIVLLFVLPGNALNWNRDLAILFHILYQGFIKCCYGNGRTLRSCL